MIEQLPSLNPNAIRTARTRARCHDKIDRRRAGAQAGTRYVAERNALLGFGVIYLSAIAAIVMRVLIR